MPLSHRRAALGAAILFVAFIMIWRAQTTMDEVERTITAAAKVPE